MVVNGKSVWLAELIYSTKFDFCQGIDKTEKTVKIVLVGLVDQFQQTNPEEEMENTKGTEELRKLNGAIRTLKDNMVDFVPAVSITLGSGLDYMVKLLSNSNHLRYQKIPYCPLPSATGHQGRLYWGELCGLPVAMLQGRVHCNEEDDVHRVVFLTRALAKLGCKKFIFTHAVGAVNKNLEPRDIVAIRSHVGFNCPDPTAGLGIPLLGTEFTPMGEAYSSRLLALAKKCALKSNVSLHWGVSYFKVGRTYETEAEVEMMRRAGADVATMSTVPEVIAAVHMGAEVLDLALVTNMGAGLGSTVPLSHDEVKSVAKQMKKPFGDLIKEIINEMKIL